MTFYLRIEALSEEQFADLVVNHVSERCIMCGGLGHCITNQTLISAEQEECAEWRPIPINAEVWEGGE